MICYVLYHSLLDILYIRHHFPVFEVEGYLFLLLVYRFPFTP